MVVSVPRELSSDHSAVLRLAEASGCVTKQQVEEKLNWDNRRTQGVLAELMQVYTALRKRFSWLSLLTIGGIPYNPFGTRYDFIY